MGSGVTFSTADDAFCTGRVEDISSWLATMEAGLIMVIFKRSFAKKKLQAI